MAAAEKSITMNVAMADLLAVIRDFEKYPEFVAGCESAKILAREDKKTRVQYAIEIMSKDVGYTLDHSESSKGDGEATLSWKLVDSAMLKANNGSWTLKKVDKKKTEVTYSLELDFKIPVPGFILNTLVKSSLPAMLKSFEDRTKEVSGG